MKKKPSVQKRDMAQRMLIERRGAGAGKHHTRDRDVAKGIRRKGKHPEKFHENPVGWGDYKAAIPIVSGIAYVPNPLARVTSNLGGGKYESGEYRGKTFYCFILFDLNTFPAPESVLGFYEFNLSAAAPGHGQLTYELAARALGETLEPGDQLSEEAEILWERIGGESQEVDPMPDAYFVKKYGGTATEILRRAPKVSSQQVQAIKKMVTSVVSNVHSGNRARLPSARRNNPQDLAGRFIPERYLAGLPPALQKQRIRELTQSRDAYWKGDYSELPTDRAARKMGLVKQSKYTTEAKKRGIEYRGDLHDMASRVLRYYGARATSSEVQQFADALKKSFSKGLAAWKSGGHRPGATAQNWAVARVNSLVVGGKTSWTADKKLFEVLPAEVRAKIEAMRMKQNPIKVMVEGQPPADVLSGKHTRFYQSRAALDRIEEQGREVIPAITFRIEWGYKLHQDARQRGGIRFEKGERGVVTLVVDATRTQTLADEAERRRLAAPPLLQQVRSGRVTLYTAHTILHRLGDQIMPAIANLSLMEFRYEPNLARGVAAGLVVTDRVERAWRQLAKALWSGVNHFGGRMGAFERWLPTVVDTKACREGWITDSLQAMAETVPYRLLYKKGREQGVKLLSDLPFVPALEAALTEYIDASMDMLKGYQVEI